MDKKSQIVIAGGGWNRCASGTLTAVLPKPVVALNDRLETDAQVAHFESFE